MVKLHVILVQSEGDPEIDLVDGEVVARETFSILTTTAVIRPNTIINLFLGRTKSSSHGGLYLRPIPSNPQHADWLNAILPRNYVTDRPILLEHKCGHTTFVLGGFSQNGHTTFVLGDLLRNGHTTFVCPLYSRCISLRRTCLVLTCRCVASLGYNVLKLRRGNDCYPANSDACAMHIMQSHKHTHKYTHIHTREHERTCTRAFTHSLKQKVSHTS